MAEVRKMHLAPEGLGIVLVSGCLFLLSLGLTFVFGWKIMLAPTIITGLGFIACLQFFRDPDRFPPTESDRYILSPADGVVADITDTPEANPLGVPCIRVGIFLSPLNVHINRTPMAGTVQAVVFTPGKFLGAFKPEASAENERNLILMETAYGPIAFIQITGAVARRIVCHLKAGDKVTAGQRMGMIRFGSRTELYVPRTATIKVKIGDKVAGGETIMGEY